jgi:hypothetical protein
MSKRRSFAWRAAFALAAHAARILPRERHEWSRAMISEVDHSPNARAAFSWALGCLFASYFDRMHTMNRSLGKISAWVLSLEMLVCLIPATLFFAAIVSTSMSGAWPARDVMLYASAALIGPVGLALTIRIVLLRKSIGLAIGAASCTLALWTPLAYWAIVRGQLADSSDWRSLALMGLLPALAVAHLAFIAFDTRRT